MEVTPESQPGSIVSVTGTGTKVAGGEFYWPDQLTAREREEQKDRQEEHWAEEYEPIDH